MSGAPETPDLRLLLITQELDAHSTNLGVAHLWCGHLARRTAELHVVASTVGVVDLPANVRIHTLNRERGAGRAERWIRLLGHCHRLTHKQHVDGVLAHMVPAYALAAAPWARLRGVPLVLWYTSHGRSGALARANRAISAAATASPESYPASGGRAFVLGHGIDTERFAPAEKSPTPNDPPVIGTAGRMTPLKGFDAAIRALALLKSANGRPALLRIAGEPFYPADRAYRDELVRLARSLGVIEQVEFLGGLTAPEMPDFYRSLDVFVNWRAAPALDKTGLEALASGTTLVTNNQAYASVLGPFANDFLVEGTPEALARGIESALSLHPSLRAGMIERLRRVTLEQHSAAGLADRLVELFRSLPGGRAPAFPTVAASDPSR